jgi:tRNA threonylcarbamoyl adenosine modification protein YeaZ
MWLAIDTATDRASVALGLPGGTGVERTVAGARRHAAELLPAIRGALEAEGARLEQIEGVLLSDGPGSFTGLRVGASVAKALVQTHGVGLWTAPSLMVCAAGLDQEGRLVLAVADALRGELFAAAYRVWTGAVETVVPASVYPPERLRVLVPNPDLITGPAAGELGGVSAFPSARALLGLMGKSGGARRLPDPVSWSPEYGRPAEAQAKWERIHGRPLSHSAGRTG